MHRQSKPSVLIIYDSKTGNTEQMAQFVKKGVEEEGLSVELKKVDDLKTRDLLKADGIIVGSPTYYGLMTGKIKSFFDKSVEYHGKLDGKVGAAFATSGVLGGGNESTVLSIIQCFLVHGMIVQGSHTGGHYGAVSIGKPDSKAQKEAIRLGKRTAALVRQTIS